ncbi:MAG: TlpA family protein disulfide reductase [Prevotellaceae bacterium]|jgi:thiol-disulfide isomerase/thioredoxin|nr:TlpA family protein disulfide reductase [Prevotellaceae bacterium]
MKSSSVIILLLFISVGNSKEIVITGQITGEAGNKQLVYTVPIDGTCYGGFSDTLKTIDGTGAFELKFESEYPVFIKFWLTDVKKFKSVKLPVEPDNHYHIAVDARAEDITPSGANEKGLILYAGLPDPAFVEMEARDLRKDTSLVSIHEKIMKLKQDDSDKFKALFDVGEISGSFYDMVKIDRDCYYAALEAILSLGELYRRDSAENRCDVLRNLEKIYAQYPVNSSGLTVSTFWNEYARHYLQTYMHYSKVNDDRDLVSEVVKPDARHTCLMNEAKACLSGKALEFYCAGELFSESIQKNYEKELISLFEQFKKDYPQSKYTQYIEPVIRPIVEYHKAAEQPFGESVVFMNNQADVNSLEEAIKPLKGKKIYIDIWATWCGPCKQEFENNEALKKILADNDVQMLYISIDNDDREKQWQENIKYYNLAGAHIRANKTFVTDLHRRFDKKAGKHIAIPWYILVDESGNIIREHARAPSQIVKDGKPM